jgi:ribosome-binding protein aMBF1 (putative translation factor)
MDKRDIGQEILEGVRAIKAGEGKQAATPWREAFPEAAQNMPGTAIRGARVKEGLTQTALSEKTGIPQRHISEMENGKRTIGKEMARKLAEVLQVDYRVFL